MYHRRSVEVLNEMTSHPRFEWLCEPVPANAFPSGFAFVDRSDMTLAEQIGRVVLAIDLNRNDVAEAAMLVRARELRLVLLRTLEPC